jgi:MoaA/NifB/PqqE/SkfB family radical SAM enzyme
MLMAAGWPKGCKSKKLGIGMSELNGLGTINIELTSRCNKKCWMCGRRKVDREYPEFALDYGDMDFNLLEHIAGQLPPEVVVQLHRDGDALLYPRFGEAAALFANNIRNIVTNGKLLVEKAGEIIGNLETLSVSIFEKDEEAKEQREIIRKFLLLKGDKKPCVTLRLIGDVDAAPYEEFGQQFVRRVLHNPMGSFGYVKRRPCVPEIGICWDFLMHPCINRKGEMSICVRFDPEGLGVLGSVCEHGVAELWNGEKRTQWKALHVAGKRNSVPLCARCEYWGVPIAP